MNLEKLYRIKSQLEEIGELRRVRGERYRAKITRSNELRVEALLGAHSDVQPLSLASLLALSSGELRDAAVDEKALQRAAIERRQADDVLKAGHHEEANFRALSILVQRLCDYAGEPRP